MSGDYRMMNMSDEELLRHYANEGANPSLAALVHRHLDLVYSVARRHVSSSQIAEDVAQAVFIELARHARKISPDTPLVAWLHVVSRRIAINAARGEARRHAREQAAAEIAAMKSPPPAWETVAPLLDEAVESLPAPDRAAILLRYFENRKLRDVGAALGLTDDAAQKRVSRALEQLRTFFKQRGVTVTATGLASELSAHALGSAPVALGPIIAAAAANAVPPATFSAATTIAMTTVQKFCAAAAVMAAAVTVYEATVIFRQSSELERTRTQAAAVVAQLADLRSTQKTNTGRLASLHAQRAARLTLAIKHIREPGDAALEAQMNAWLTQLDRLRSFLIERPQFSIPELQFLPDDSWFSIAAGGKIESEEDLRRATASLRSRAENIAVSKISQALIAYTRANNDQLPDNPGQLAPYFNPPIDPAILDRYEMQRRGKVSDVPRSERMRIITAKTPVDIEYDVYHWAGVDGHGNTGSAMGHNLRTAQSGFRRDFPGEDATIASRLVPYLKWPVDVAVLQRYIERQQSGGAR